MYTTLGFLEKPGHLEGHKHYIYVQKMRTEVGKGKYLSDDRFPM